MSHTVGTVVRGVRTPVIRQGDPLADIVVDSLLQCAEAEGLQWGQRDVIGVTEAVVARAQGNYANTDQIAEDIRAKFPGGEAAMVFPILSRNRFSVCLKGICKGLKKLHLMLSYPSDEVGNELVSLDALDQKGINPYSDVLSEDRFRALFGSVLHPFTGVDYIAFYRQVAEEAGCEVEISMANDPRFALQRCKDVICADIHSHARTKRLLEAAGARSVITLTDILTKPVGDSGYNPDYGLLGSNKATEDSIKLFPRDCHEFIVDVQQRLYAAIGQTIEVMVYGDGAFKDPVGGIWELADPVVSPAYTDGLFGTPHEIKLKYLADNELSDLSGAALDEAMKARIRQKSSALKDTMQSMGTTPRRLCDLLGSLCDLTSGSGDKGTPVIWIQGYFDNYAT